METTTQNPTIENQLSEILKVDFGCHTKYEGLDHETPTFIRVNVKESLNAEQTQGLLDFKERHAFDDMITKRSGAGISISFVNEA